MMAPRTHGAFGGRQEHRLHNYSTASKISTRSTVGLSLVWSLTTVNLVKMFKEVSNWHLRKRQPWYSIPRYGGHRDIESASRRLISLLPTSGRL